MVTAADLTAMIHAIEIGVPGVCPSDIDLDGEVDGEDLRYLIELMFEQ